jgi:FAD/FMN-containing dehydrogenase
MMRDLVLGLEVVLADGRVLEALSGLRKDNTGYDIKSLFLGAEGTLGVITAATLKLFPQIHARATALVAVPDLRAAVDLLGRLRRASSDRVGSFEVIPRIALELTVRHIDGCSDPFATPHAWYALCELESARAGDPLPDILAEALEAALSGTSSMRATAASASVTPCGRCVNPSPKRAARASSTISPCR